MTSLLAILASAALLLAGCASSQAANDPASAAGANTVTMAKSYIFEPREISVTPGTAVTWVNEDNFTHTVRIGDDVVGQAAPGESFDYTFSAAGTFDYDCSLHPQDMRGVVTVAP